MPPEALEAAGAEVRTVSVPSAVLGLSAYYLIAPAEASSNLARYDGVRYGLRVDAANAAEMNIATRTAGFGAEVKRRIMLGTYALSAGYYDAFYGKALRVRTLMLREFAAAYEDVDILLCPTAPTTAFALGAKTADPLLMYLNDVCTIPSNLTGHPAISVPFGQRRRRASGGCADHGPGPVGAAHLPGRRRAGAGRARHGEPAVSAAGPGREAPLPNGWELVVGLEVHVELSTATKLFCGCANRFGDEPNTNVCPVCLGLPGSLPVVNSAAVHFAMRLGRALGCEVRPAVFARKNYFYPDMPKDYQISQYDQPTNIDGRLELPDRHVVGIERAHIEEDTGKTTHIGGGGRIHDADYALVDYNRAGVPLVEIVSRPDIRTAEQARAYVRELRAILLVTRRVRCPHGGGLHAGGRQRVGAALRLRRAAHPLRDQEPELAALPGPGHHLRGPPPCGLVVERGAAPPGDPPLGRGGRAHHAGPLQGGRRGLPLLPGPRPGAAGPVGRDRRRDRCGAAPATRGPPGRAPRRGPQSPFRGAGRRIAVVAERGRPDWLSRRTRLDQCPPMRLPSW